MRNYFTFAGTDSRDLGVYISGSGVYSSPERTYEDITIPGRNGLLLGNERRLENIEVTYPAFVYGNLAQRTEALRSFLLSQIGYKRLEDSYHPDEYRLGFFRGPLEVEPSAVRDAGSFDLTFNCKPQRFLKSGEQTLTFGTSGTVTNPTLFKARPLLRIYGTGTLNILDEDGNSNGYITINTASGYTDIDCEIMEAYKGSASCNGYVSVGNDFPVLSPGENTLSCSGEITAVDLTGRWFTV